MSDYCFRKTFCVNYADCDEYDNLKPSALLVYAQEVAGLSADELGFGYKDTIPFNQGFVIVTTCCEIARPAHPNELLTVESWPLPPRHSVFERVYAVNDERGERVASVSSRWCLVDFTSGKILPPDVLKTHSTCPYRAEQIMKPVWALPKLAGEGEEVYSLLARSSHLDHFHHVNNTKYADFFMDCFSREELQNKLVKSFRISYAKQVTAGEEMTFFRKDTEEGTAFEARVQGEPTTRFFVTFEEAIR